MGGCQLKLFRSTSRRWLEPGRRKSRRRAARALHPFGQVRGGQGIHAANRIHEKPRHDGQVHGTHLTNV